MLPGAWGFVGGGLVIGSFWEVQGSSVSCFGFKGSWFRDVFVSWLWA